MSYTLPVLNEQPKSVVSGTIIDGKYRLGRMIGSGGMGTVYEATQIDLDRKVALKLLRNKYAGSSKIVTRFQQEARLAGSIEHDNICRVTDHGTAEGGAPYLVMPLLYGRSLAKMLEDKPPPSQMRVIDIVCQTLMALEAAHKEKIVHRDLKPDNIFVTKMGDREDFVKLLDFGISKVIEKKSVSNLTQTGTVLGTAYYLAPEQAKGAKRIDHRVDIYAMGVILYEALTGRRPFDGDSYNEVMFKIVGEPFKQPRSLNKDILPGVEKVIFRAMAIDPNARYSSALEMCDALERALIQPLEDDGSPMKDTLADTMVDDDNRPSALGVETKSRQNRLWYFVAIGVVLAIVLAGILWANKDGVDETTSAQPEKSVLSQPSVSVDQKKPQKIEVPKEKKLTDAVKGTDVIEQIEPRKEPQSPAVSSPQTDATEKVTPPPVLQPKPSKRKRGNVIKGKQRTTFVFED